MLPLRENKEVKSVYHIIGSKGYYIIIIQVFCQCNLYCDFVMYMWHLLHVCLSSVELPDVSPLPLHFKLFSRQRMTFTVQIAKPNETM